MVSSARSSLRTLVRLVAVATSIAAACDCAARETPPPGPSSAPSPAPPAEPTTKVEPAPPRPADPPVGHAPKAPISLEEYFKTSRVWGASFSFDEKLIAYANASGDNLDGRPDVWVAPVAGGRARQVTHVSGRLHSFAFSPGANRLLFEADQNGNELPHIYLTNAAGDAPRDLMADYPAGRRTEFIAWEPSGSAFLYRSNLRDEQYLDLYEYDVKKSKSELLWKSSGKFSADRISRDGQSIIVSETISDIDSNLYLVLRSKPESMDLLTKHQGDVLYTPLAFSKDQKTLYFASDQGNEFQQLYAMDLAKKNTVVVQKTSWDVEAADFSFTWKYFVTLTNEDGALKLDVADVIRQKSLPLPAPPGGGGWEPLAFSRSDRFLAVRLQTDSAPVTIYVVDLKSGKSTRVVDPLPPSLKDRRMVSGVSVRIRSFDQREVPALLYRPEGNGPFPAVIQVHGGPTAQSRREFDRMRQYLVSKGYVVLVPNVRGSTGYGKSYTRLDNLDLGGGPLKDVVACKNWLAQNEHVDPAKVVVMGASYGGYMALAAATFTPTEFAALIDFFGVSDLKSLVESFPPYWQAFATYIFNKFGDPKNPEHSRYQHDRSPLNFVDKIERPLLVVQGDQDARVKKDQSDRMVEAIKKRGIPVHYLVLHDEGHGFSKNEHYLMAFQAADRFLDRYLYGDTSVTVLQ